MCTCIHVRVSGESLTTINHIYMYTFTCTMLQVECCMYTVACALHCENIEDTILSHVNNYGFNVHIST